MSTSDNPFSALDKMLFSQPASKKQRKPKAKLRRKSRRSKEKPAKKKLPVTPVDQSSRPNRSTESVSQSTRPVESTDQPDQSTRPIDSTDRPDQSSQSTQPIGREDQSSHQLTGAVVKRPLAFYIPLSINEKIEEAVLYYQQNYNKKIDRSAVVSAVLGNPDVWTKKNLDALAGSVIDQWRNRLSDRLSNRLEQSTR